MKLDQTDLEIILGKIGLKPKQIKGLLSHDGLGTTELSHLKLAKPESVKTACEHLSKKPEREAIGAIPQNMIEAVADWVKDCDMRSLMSRSGSRAMP